MAALTQDNISAPPQIVLTTDAGDAIDVAFDQAERAPSLSTRITDMIHEAFPEAEVQNHNPNEQRSTTASTPPETHASFADPSSSNSASISTGNISQNNSEPDIQHVISETAFEEVGNSSDEPPPPYHLQALDSQDRIISRVVIETIFPPDPLWSPSRDGRPTRRPHNRFSHIVILWPSVTLSQFKDMLMTGVRHRISVSRRFRLRSAEVMKTWLYIESSKIERTFLGFKRRKSKMVDVDESNWPIIVAALRDKTLVGELKMMFWREVPLTEAERQRQQVVAQMYRNTLRPYGIW